MGVFDRIGFGSGTGFDAASTAYGPLTVTKRITWDRRLSPGPLYNAKPWDNLTPEKAREYPAWYRALVILSTAVSGMGIDVNAVEYEDGGKKISLATDHPAYWPVCVQANEEETAPQARARMTWIAAQYSSAYAAIWRQVGRPIQIIPFAPYQCWPERIDGVKWYLVDADGSRNPSKMRKLRSDDVIEISLPSDDGLYPDETWMLGRTTLHEGVSGHRVRSARAMNSGRPRLALTTDQILKDTTIKRLREEFPHIHNGLDDQVVPAILDSGMKPVPIPYQPEYAAENVLHGISLRGVQNLTGVPSTFLGDVEGRSYNAFEYDVKYFYEFGLSTWLNAFEDQYRSKLLAPTERRERRTDICFDRQTTKFADTKTMAELIRALGAGAPIAKINEIRAKLGMSALEDEEAKKLFFPKNMGNTGAENTPSDGATPGPGRPSAFRGGSESTRLIVEKIVRRMSHEAARKSSVVKAYMEYAGDLHETYQALVESDFRVLSADGGIWNGKNPADCAREFIDDCKVALLDMAGEAKQGQLSAVVDKSLPKFAYEIPDRFINRLTGDS